MKTASAQLIALLGTGSFVFADLYTITPTQGGTIIRVTTADVDIKVGATTWVRGVPIDPEAAKATGHWKVGLDVDNWKMNVLPRATDPITGAAYPDTINGQPWLAALRVGALDGAVVQVDRAYAATWPQPWVSPVVVSSTLVLSALFVGKVADVIIKYNSAEIMVNSVIELITNTQMPRNLYQPGCKNTLFDSACTLNAATFSRNASIATVVNQSQFTAFPGSPGGSATYTLGRCRFTSGNNNGFTRLIRSWDGTNFNLMSPPPYTMVAGDTVTVFAGCDKAFSTCTLFANTANFGGQPFIPVPETAI